MLEENGWVTIHRKIMTWEWYDDANTFRLFVHLLLNANHKANKWRGHDIERGQLIVGRKKLAKDLKLSEQQIRTSLNKLKSTNEVTIKTTNKFSLLTIVKYDNFQSKENKSTNKSPANEPTSNQQVTTNNNDNNDNNKKNGGKRFAPPTLLEVENYIEEKNLQSVDAQSFISFYESKGWMIGKNKMKSWKATVSGWHSRNNSKGQNNETSSGTNKENHRERATRIINAAIDG